MKKIIYLINVARMAINLPLVSYNYILDNQLNDHLKQVGPAWFYESGPQSSNFTYQNTTRINDLKGSFLSIQGSKYIYRDTYKDSIERIIRMRVNQRDCFDYSKCSNSSFELFTSCMKDLIIFENGLKCSWAYAYQPWHVLPSLKSIAILPLNYQGRYVPNNLRKVQKKSFWVYGYYDSPKTDRDVCNEPSTLC